VNEMPTIERKDSPVQVGRAWDVRTRRQATSQQAVVAAAV